MSATLTDAGRLCRAVVVPIHRGADPGSLRAALARATGGAARLWVRDIPADAGSTTAAAYRDAELGRPVNPRTGPGLRTVLLRYRDGTAELVVVAHRTAADPREAADALLGGRAVRPAARAAPTEPPTEQLVEAPTEPPTGQLVEAPTEPPTGQLVEAPTEPPTEPLIEPLVEALRRIDRAPAPDWGLGTPGADGADRCPVTLPGATPRTAVAALALVLARCTGRDRVPIGTADPRAVLTVDVDEAVPVEQYLDAVGTAAVTFAGSPAEVVAGLMTTEPADVPFLTPVHPLSIQLGPAGDGAMAGVCWSRRDRFAEPVVERLVRMLVTAHHDLLTAAPGATLADVDLFDADARRELAQLGGLGPAPRVPATTIHRAVADQASRTPDAVAVCYERDRLTYRELDEQTNRAAHGLRRLGIRPGDRVGICLDRSLDLVVMLLAVLKTGAAYVPIDPAYPADRKAFIAGDAELAVVVTDAADIGGPDGPVLVPPGSLRLAEQPVTPLDAGQPDDQAYVIYTSGSTGRPKGVKVPHRNVLALLAATQDDLALTGRDVWTLFHSVAFDFSVWEIWMPLMTGGRLVVVPYWLARDPAGFAALLADEQVTVLNQTPSAFAQLMEIDREQPLNESLRLVIFGGEPLDAGPLRFWFDRHPEHRCRLVNMFGITETTVHVTAQTVTRAEALEASRSVGGPLPGWHVHILDRAGRPVPPGVAGEICVGGAGVADGYLNRPDLTAQRFVPDPFAPGRMYRSGDRGRLLPDGRLEHLGRLDNQVKLRGYRIELDEIRARLLDAPSVAAAAVVLRGHGDSAGARLDGYVVFRGGHGDVGEVRQHAARFLPEYMVPATVTALPALPLTPNGKLDAARLPEPLDGPSRGRPAPAGTGLQDRLQAVWDEVFGFRISTDDDFFALGGNSLLAVRLSAAMRTAGLPRIPLRQLYLTRTVRTLSAALAGAGTLERREPA